ncbi:hypothetical protein [Sphingomonas bacterium]|uniref:hypothetical protein n=1 Tax=Sphingomonas bacterium TaxID=1895847 RepID=UPI001576453A|nr:hypothetical protein [Sphingomonas bacterium]
MRIRSTTNRVLVGVDPSHPGTGGPDAGGTMLLLPHNSPLSWLARAAFDAEDPVARMARSLCGSIAAAVEPGEAPIQSTGVIGLDTTLEASILAANLAISYAQLGTPTVLIDANIQISRQHALFGVAASGGLIAALSGEGSARALAEPTAVRNLSVLPAGSPSGDASVLLDGERFHRRAMPLLESFATMIVDVGAPFGEPPSMCGAIDAMILVVRRDVTTLEAVRRMGARLADMKTRVVGIVVAE